MTTKEDIVEKLCDIVERQFTMENTRGFVITAILKLCAHIGNYYPPHVAEVIEKYQSSCSTDIQQRCYEFRALALQPDIMADVLPVDAFDEDLEVDLKLSFLDDYVEDYVRQGGRRYEKSRSTSRSGNSLSGIHEAPSQEFSGLRFDAYAIPTNTTVSSPDIYSQITPETQEDYNPEAEDRHMEKPTARDEEHGMFGDRNIQNKWSEDGYAPENAAVSNPNAEHGTPKYPPPPRSALSTYDKPNLEKRNRESEKERMAANLFQFEETESGRGKKSHKKKKKKKKKGKKESRKSQARKNSLPPTKAPQKPHQKPPSLSSMLFDDNNDDNNSNNNVDNILGLGISNNNASSPPPQQASLESMFGDLSVGTPSNNSNNNNNGGDNLDDMFGGSQDIPNLSSGGGLLVASHVVNFPNWKNNGGLQNLKSLSLAVGLHNKVKGSPSGEVQNLDEDDHLHCAYRKVFTSQGTTLLLYLSNKSDAPITNLEIDLKISDAFVTDFEEEGGIISTGTGFAVESVDAFCTVICAVSLGWKKPTANMSSSATVAFLTSSKEPRGSSFAIPLGLQDILRPLSIPGAEFSKLWAANVQEKKLTVADSSRGENTQAFIATAENQFHLHIVNSAENEVICAGQVAGLDKIVLLQCLVGPSPTVTVRTSDKFLTEVMVKVARHILASK